MKMNRIQIQMMLGLLMLIFVLPVMAQTKSNKKKANKSPKMAVVDKMPVFVNGGQEGVYKIIADSMQYPSAAKEERVGGKVLVKFKVDTLGKVFDIGIVEGIRPDLDQEAKRMVGLLKKWTPAYSKGRKVRVEMKLPLYFFPDVNFQREWEEKNKK